MNDKLGWDIVYSVATLGLDDAKEFVKHIINYIDRSI